MGTIISSFLLIFLAEMGDKTQLLALAFSTKYKINQVLIGVFLGAFLNHGLAIVFASFISNYVSLDLIKVVAAIMFIIFGLWSLKLEYEDEDEEDEASFSFKTPILTVASAFFIGELGDKTQLTAMTLGAKSAYPFLTLLGTTSGMIAVSLIGILVGKVLGKRIPEVTMKVLASIIFLGFGLSGLYSSVDKIYFTPTYIALFSFILALSIGIILKTNSKNHNIYYEKKLAELIAKCRHCDIHDTNCITAMQIRELTQKYVGQDLPYIGDIILYFESMKKVAPKKATNLEKIFHTKI